MQFSNHTKRCTLQLILVLSRSCIRRRNKCACFRWWSPCELSLPKQLWNWRWRSLKNLNIFDADPSAPFPTFSKIWRKSKLIKIDVLLYRVYWDNFIFCDLSSFSFNQITFSFQIGFTENISASEHRYSDMDLQNFWIPMQRKRLMYFFGQILRWK